MTGSDRNPFDLESCVRTIENKMSHTAKKQAQNVVFVANNDVDARLVAEYFAGNRHVRIVNPLTGFDSGDLPV